MSGSTAHKLLNGIMKYRSTIKSDLVKHFEFVQNNPNPKTIFFTCVDSRVVASRILQADPGITYLLRNPGNMIPCFKKTVKQIPTAEPAALELATVYNKVHSVVVCGHSDCKTLNFLYDLQYKKDQECELDHHLHNWLLTHGSDSIAKFDELRKSDFKKPLRFYRADNVVFEAHIDPENRYSPQEKFSQVHVLEQLKNLTSYNFMSENFKKRCFQAHALWFDVNDGELYMFSFDEQRFVRIDESTYNQLYQEAKLGN